MKIIHNLLTEYEAIDTNKETDVVIPYSTTASTKLLSTTIGSFIVAVPYFIRTIYYSGKDEHIIHHLSLQFNDLDGVYKRFENEVAVVVTSACNLACSNCNMLSQFKSTFATIKLDYVDKFIAENKDIAKDTMIRLTGGEPAILGSKLDAIIIKFYTAGFKHMTLLTNGILPYTPPYEIAIENSAKTPTLKPSFNTTFIAPIDLPEFNAMPQEVYGAGCLQADVCGISYTQKGEYFPCPTGSMIYPHLLKAGLIKPYSAHSLKEVRHTKHKFYKEACKYCGMFKKGGYHGFDTSVYDRVTTEERSATWEGVKI